MDANQGSSPNLPARIKRHIEPEKKLGRPPSITPEKEEELFLKIMCEPIGNRRICKECGIDYTVFMRKILNDEEFGAKYYLAKQMQAEGLAEETIEIADEEVEGGDMAAVRRNESRVKARQWYAERLYPKIYASKRQVEHTLNAPKAATDDQFRAMLQEFREMKQQEAATKNDSRNSEYEDAQVVD